MPRMSRCSLAAVCLGAGLAAAPAHASLLGREFTASYEVSGTTTPLTPSTFTADTDAAAESRIVAVNNIFALDVDVSAGQVLLTPVALIRTNFATTFGASFTRFLVLTATGADPLGIAGASLVGSLANFTAGDITWTDSEIRIDLAGLSFNMNNPSAPDPGPFGASFTFAAPPPPPSPVPEPAALALLGAGLVGLAAARRRRLGQADRL